MTNKRRLEENGDESEENPSKRTRTEVVETHPKVIEEGFVKGSIKRVKLKNFVTYDDCEFYPGPHLNIVIGPNGTGKSSIVCALAVGLAAPLNILGRAKEINSYIKHGKKNALVEIELWGSNVPGQNSTTISRYIEEKSSVWKINGKMAKKEEVVNLVREWNIQVDNLCQFLPQDRVASFAALSPQQILRETEKAVGSEATLQMHDQLILLHQKEKSFESTVKDMGQHLQDLEERNAVLEKDVEKFRERERQLDNVKKMEQKRPWLEFEIQREKASVLQESVKQKEQEYSNYEKEKFGPLEKQIKELEKKSSNLDTEKEKNIRVFRDLERETKKKREDLERLETDHLSIEEELKNLEQRTEERKKRALKMQKDVDNLKNELRSYPTPEELDIKGEELEKKKRSLLAEISPLQALKLETKDKIIEISNLISAKQKRLKEMDDSYKQKLDFLSKDRDSVHVYHAYKWIQANDSKFQKKVYGPLYLEVNVPNPLHARFLEHVCPKWLLHAFICQTPEDRAVLLKERNIREWSKLNISILTGEFDHEAQRPVSKSQLEKYFINFYLDEVIECPEIIKDALRRNAYIHTTALGSEKTSTVADALFEKTRLQNLLTPTHSYGAVRSSYGNNELSIRMDPLKTSKWFGGVDVQLKKQIKSELQDLQTSHQNFEVEHQEFENKEKALQLQQRQNKEELDSCREMKKKRDSMETKLRNYESQLQELKTEENTEEEENKLKRQLRTLILKRFSLLSQLKDSMKKQVEVSMKNDVISLQKAQLNTQLSNLNAQKNTFNFELERLKQDLKELKERFQYEKNKVKELKEKAESVVKFTDQMKAIFETFPDDLEELEDLINVTKAQADLNTSTDPEIIVQYEKRKKEIEELKKRVSSASTEYENLKQQIDILKEKWIPPLETLISKINSSFSNYFSRIGCVGQVELIKADNYEDWAIGIKVKFRDEDASLHNLNAQMQSGGERSVSTMLYLVSLQDLTSCPFRLVDEINQGMDPHNERMIFDVVAESACRPGVPQYFLITPKLLPDLKLTKDMTILCVFNGPWQIPQEKWDIQKFIQ